MHAFSCSDVPWRFTVSVFTRTSTRLDTLIAHLQDMNVPEGDSQVTKGVGSPSAQKAEAGSTKAAARKAPPKKKQRRRQAA